MPVITNFSDNTILYAENLNSSFVQTANVQGDNFQGPLSIQGVDVLTLLNQASSNANAAFIQANNTFSLFGAPHSSNLIHWWLASQATTDVNGQNPAANGNSISCIVDKGSNQNNATQANTANSPIYVANGLNGYPVLSFSGTEYLTFTDSTDPSTIFILYQTTFPQLKPTNSGPPSMGGYWNSLISGDATNATLTQFGYTATATTGLILSNDVYSDRWRSYIRTGTNDSGTNYITYSWSGISQAQMGIWDIFGIVNNQTSIQTYKGSHAAGNPAMKPPSLTLSTLNGNGLIGASWFSHVPGAYLIGNIAEILVYNKVLTDGQKMQVVSYLQNKYGLVEPDSKIYFGFQGYNESGSTYAPNENMFFMTSSDGINFDYRPSHLIQYSDSSNLHAVRNSSILRYNGNHWAAIPSITIGNGIDNPGNVIDIFVSTDNCRNFNWVQTISTGATFIVGAHWFTDTGRDIHLIVTQGPGNGFQPYEIHPTTPGLLDGPWSTLTQITGSNFPASILDCSIIKSNSTYYLYYSNQNTESGFIDVATSANLTNSYVVTANGNWAGWGGNFESPCIVPLGPTSGSGTYPQKQFQIFLDSRGTGIYTSYTNNGILGSWTTPVPVNTPTTIQALQVVYNTDDFAR
jgi:hypothetical protein